MMKCNSSSKLDGDICWIGKILLSVGVPLGRVCYEQSYPI